MPIKKPKKTVKVAKEPEVEKTEVTKPPEKYFSAVGKRKTSVAQVRIYKSKKAETETVVNGRKFSNYFPIARLQELIMAPLIVAGQGGIFNISIKVAGGGVNGQAEAIRLGISRALVNMDETLRKQLKNLGFLTRDSRIVERKKPGLKKARRAPQWAKR
ncbi:MAG TPA: 30S ribosomal protein S9 [Patescibacteria group bacterium]